MFRAVDSVHRLLVRNSFVYDNGQGAIGEVVHDFPTGMEMVGDPSSALAYPMLAASDDGDFCPVA